MSNVFKRPLINLPFKRSYTFICTRCPFNKYHGAYRSFKSRQNLLAPITVGWLSLPKGSNCLCYGYCSERLWSSRLNRANFGPLCNCCFFNYHNLICLLYSCHFSNFKEEIKQLLCGLALSLWPFCLEEL